MAADHILFVVDITTLNNQPRNLRDVITSFSDDFSLMLNSKKSYHSCQQVGLDRKLWIFSEELQAVDIKFQ